MARTEPRNVPTGAALSLGVAIALFTSTLPDAVLLPAVDRATPRALGLAVVGVLISVGWSCVARARTRTFDSRAILILTALALAGGFLTAVLLPWWRDALALGLRGRWGFPYYPLIALVVAACVAPIAASCGALFGVLVGDGRRATWTPLLVGVAAGWAFGPWLAQSLLGPERVLQIAALLCGTAGVLLAERGPLEVTSARLARGAAPAFLLLGAATLVAGRELAVSLDRGSFPRSLLAASIALVAAIAIRLPQRWSARFGAPLVLAAAGVGAMCLFCAEPYVAASSPRDVWSELARVFAVAVAPGLALGLLSGSSGTGLRVGLAPAALVLLAPVVTWFLLPVLGPRVLVAALAVPVALSMLRERPVPVWGFALLAIAAIAALAGLGPSPSAGSVLASREIRVSEGRAIEVRDEAEARTLVAIDGHAPFGRSAGQQRRFAHVPILLNGPAHSVLVVSSGDSETARAAWMHGPAKMHWLRPFDVPESWDPRTWNGSDPPTNGSERQFLAVDRGLLYDVIVLAPDPRADRRTATTGTVESFELVRSRLAPNGTLCQWYDLADVHITDLRAVMASALAVFPHVYLVADHPRTRRACIGLLARNVPLEVWPARVDDVLRKRADIGADFASIDVDGLGLACMVFADRGLIELAAPEEAALRDERPVIGIRHALCADDASMRMRLGLDFIARYRREPTPWLRLEAAEYVRVSAAARERFKAWRRAFDETRADVDEHGFSASDS